MTAIEGSTVKCSTLVDGTLRVVIDVEPKHAQEAFTLFGSPGRGVAMAALADGRCALVTPPAPPHRRTPAERDEENRAAASERWHAKGPLQRAAIELCAVETFQDFIGVTTAKEAGERIKQWCGIPTRKVLDESHEAAAAFRELFLEPYQRYMAEREPA
jgi:hypothetical protein